MAGLIESIGINTDNIPVSGVKGEIVLIDKNIIDTSLTIFDETNPSIIKNIGLKTGKKAVKYSTSKSGVKPSYEFEKQEVGGQYKHSLELKVFSTSQETFDEISKLSLIDVVAISEGNDGIFRVAGFEQGLTLTVMSYLPQDVEGGRYISITLSSDDSVAKETKPVRELNQGTYKDTSNLVYNTLLNPAS